MRLASFSTSSTDFTTLTPPALPRPPAWICAFTTQTGPPSSFARLDGFLDREGRKPARDRNTELAQDCLRLILVDVHVGPLGPISKLSFVMPGLDPGIHLARAARY